MGKRYKSRTCVYCAAAGKSESGDHVLARKFVPAAYSSHIPKVPACRQCNKDKSDLEHYLTTVLLFGGRHVDAVANLQNDGLRRLAKNQRLHRELAQSSRRIWTRGPSGLVVRALTVPIDGEKAKKLVGFIVRGLMWHHWKTVLGPDCFVDVLSVPTRGEAFFNRCLNMGARDRVRANIGNGALVYEGALGTDNPEVSFWELSILGGAQMADYDGTNFTSKFGVMTGPQALKDRADDRIKRGAFILTP